MRSYTLQFWLLCFSSFLFFSSFNMIVPELSQYLASLGGEEYIGLIISLFTLTAGISRPFSGKLADRWGRIPVMIIGSVVCGIVGLMYPVLATVPGFLLLRLFHGFSTGFKPTGTVAYVADIIPANKRGEAMGIVSFFGTTGMGFGPALGGEIFKLYGLNAVFYTSAVVSVCSILILMGMKETLKDRESFSLSMLKIKRSDIYEPTVIIPSVVMMLVTFSFGVALTLTPEFSKSLGIENKGLFFTYFTAASLISRIIGGRLSDRYGRKAVLLYATVVVGSGSVLIGLATTPTWFFASALLYGAGYGLSSPSIFAWAADVAPEQFRGRGFATLFIALEIGIGSGAFISGWMYGGNANMFPYVFGITGGLAFLAFLYLLSRK